jgi:small conductance mechanosensitive channel
VPRGERPPDGQRRALLTRGQNWRELGLAREFSRRAAKRARIEAVVLLPLLAGVFALYSYRRELLGPEWDTTVRLITAVALISLSWEFARALGRALGPQLLQRLDPGTAGTVGFLIRLVTMLVAVIAALRIAQLHPRTLAVGGAVTAVVVGLAAQQTLGNLIAGMVLLSARPFKVGDRVRLQGGPLAGSIEGTVTALGLLYTTLSRGDDPIMVPNSVVLNSAVVPLREPAGVHLRARLRPGYTPMDVEELLRGAVTTPIRGAPRITLEELDGDEVVVLIEATPKDPDQGPRLASEVLEAIASLTVRTRTSGGATGGGHSDPEADGQAAPGGDEVEARGEPSGSP